MDMREAFEHWIKTDKRFKFDDISLDRCEDGFYIECRAEEMWSAWQAALSASSGEQEPVGLGIYYEFYDRFTGATFDKDDMQILEKHVPPKGVQYHRLYTHPSPTAQESKLADRVTELEKDNCELRRNLNAAHAFNRNEDHPHWVQSTAVHYWQGDGHDHIESLCSGVPVVIEAKTLSELLAQESKVPEGFEVVPCSDGHFQGFVIRGPSIDGVRENTSVWPDDDNPAHALLNAMLSAAPTPVEPQWVDWTSMTSESSPHGCTLTVRFGNLEDMRSARKVLIALQRPEKPGGSE